jgi:SAM-dependent methyltransferase
LIEPRIAAAATPEDVAVAHSLGFLSSHLAAQARILEVGCGDGALGAALLGAGHDVQALEPDGAAAAVAGSRGVEVWDLDLLDLAEPLAVPPASGADRAAALGRYDAVLFCRSLHHVAELDTALRIVQRLLAPGGLLLCEELDRAHVDAATAAWFYDRRHSVLGEEATRDSATKRWLAEHDHDPPLHPGDVMLEATRRHLEIGEAVRVPYLYRYLCGRLPADRRGAEQARSLLEEESAAIERARSCRSVCAGPRAHPERAGRPAGGRSPVATARVRYHPSRQDPPILFAPRAR